MKFSMVMKEHLLPQILISFSAIAIAITNGLLSLIAFIICGALVLLVLLITRNNNFIIYCIGYLTMSAIAALLTT